MYRVLFEVRIGRCGLICQREVPFNPATPMETDEY